jgi:2-phospho-L-lactate guanylyltransferase
MPEPLPTSVRPLTTRVVAVVPVRALESAKSRLGEVLDAEERRDLVARLLDRTVAAARDARRIDEVIVVSPDPATLAAAAAAGARPLHQRGGGLNAAIDQACDVAVADGYRALVVLPGDLPLIDGPAIDALVAAADPDDGPVVVLVTDRHGRGTNALLLRPPAVIAVAFGGDSRHAHAGRASAAPARYVEIEGPLSLDLDTPEDLLFMEDRVPAGELVPAGEPTPAGRRDPGGRADEPAS